MEATGSYFHADGEPLRERNPKWLNDDYVKFIRFAQWRIERTDEGVLGFVTNHSYLDNPTFRGMRQSLMETFDEIYLLDLHGNSKKKERAPDGGNDENVFDIQQGVAIGLFVKRGKDDQGLLPFLFEEEDSTGVTKDPARVFHADLWGERDSGTGRRQVRVACRERRRVDSVGRAYPEIASLSVHSQGRDPCRGVRGGMGDDGRVPYELGGHSDCPRQAGDPVDARRNEASGVHFRGAL